MKLPLAFALGATALALACTSKNPPPPSSPAPAPAARACTEIGCVDGLRIALEPSARWPAGEYRFDFVVDGRPASCTGKLPLPACEQGGALTCTGVPVQIGESGCALPASEHGFSDVGLTSSPARVKITISRDGQPIAERELSPVYQRSQPNGPDCPPVCNSASDTWRVL
jgi:hypothetical protein